MDLKDLDFLFGEPVKSHKELKREFKAMVSEIKDIEERAGGKLTFKDYYVSADSLLIEIRSMEKEFNNNSIRATQVQTSRRNHEEESVINFIAKKDKMIDKVTMFVENFNMLDEELRMVIYYSFFKGKQNEFIGQKLFVSDYRIKLFKRKAIEELITQMKKELLMKQLKQNKSGSDDSGFFDTQILKGVVNGE